MSRLGLLYHNIERITKARAIGRRSHLKENVFLFKCDTLKPVFYLPLYRKDYIQQSIITEGTYYDGKNLNFICKEWNNGVVSDKIKNGCILDIGANIGNHTLFFFFECGIKRAICFEPVESTYGILKRNIELNHLSQNVTLVNSAVGAASGTATVSHYEKNNIGATQISLDEAGGIPVVSIDAMQIEEDVKLIKIDVEGFEKSVIDGCRETLMKYESYIMIEIMPENLAYVTAKLSELGYKHIRLSDYEINYFFYK